MCSLRTNFFLFLLLFGVLTLVSCRQSSATSVNPENSNKCSAMAYELPTDDERCYYLQESLIQAAGEGDLEKVQKALEMGANVEGIYYQSYSALYVASMNGHTKVVKYLLQNGARINRVQSVGHTALKAAVSYSHTETVKFLIDAGADICENTEISALQAAKEKNHWEIIEILQDEGAENCK